MPRVRRNGGKSNTSSNPERKLSGKADSSARSKATIKRLNMYKSGAPIRNKQGKIVGGDLMSRTQTANKPMEKSAKIAPNRRWFGNTRVISQKELDEFRDKMTEKVADPYTVLLRRKNLPMGLLLDANIGNNGKAIRSTLLDDPEVQQATKLWSSSSVVSQNSFANVIGPKKTRKRPNIAANSLTDLVERAKQKSVDYEKDESKDSSNVLLQGERERKVAQEDVFSKGQSKRIWNELYKVIDCSDVVIQVLDARDPFGTRSRFLEQHIKKDCPHKHLIFILNKVDLVPNYISKWYAKKLSEDYPTLSFHASLTKPFGKGSLIQLLRQFASLHPEKKQISVGFVGFPNVGKSSIINALKSKKVCKVAPIPGETKVWQYITLFKRVFLIDCPGVVYPDRTLEQGAGVEIPDSKFYLDYDLKYEAELVLKGVVRAERLENPEEYIDYLISKVEPKQLSEVYGIEVDQETTAEKFIEKVARKRGRLLKGGEPDVRSVAQMMIYDLQRGKLAYYVVPEELKKEKAQVSEEISE